MKPICVVAVSLAVIAAAVTAAVMTASETATTQMGFIRPRPPSRCGRSRA